MKLNKTLAVASLCLASTITPVKKAEAGLLIWNPALMLIAGTGVVASVLPYIVDYDNAMDSKFTRIMPQVFMICGALVALDHENDAIERELTRNYPSIPSYVIKEAANTLKDKANQVAFNEHGLKGVSLTDAEFKDLEAAIGSESDPKEVLAFKLLLTTPVNLNP
jgi:hypothetical protein